ncbi:hypothetical protein ScPMuIL_008357 [Solemya velum]
MASDTESLDLGCSFSSSESGADEDLDVLETEENTVAGINVQSYSFEPYESDINSNSDSESTSTNSDIADSSHMDNAWCDSNKC